MDRAVVRRLVDELGDYLVSCNFYNWGEPLLHPNIAELVEICHRARIWAVISTNLNKRHTKRTRNIFNRSTRRTLRTNEQKRPASGSLFSQKLAGAFQQKGCLGYIYQMDFVSNTPDVGRHRGIPPGGLVPKMNPSFQHIFVIDHSQLLGL
jgi:hypothetical protein